MFSKLGALLKEYFVPPISEDQFLYIPFEYGTYPIYEEIEKEALAEQDDNHLSE